MRREAAGRWRSALRPSRPPQGLGLGCSSRASGLTVDAGRRRLWRSSGHPRLARRRRGLRPGDVVLARQRPARRRAEALGREVLRGLDRGGLLLAVQRGRYVYNLDFPL